MFFMKGQLTTLMSGIVGLSLVTSSMVALNVNDYQRKIEEAKINVDALNLKILTSTIERYALEEGRYPHALEALVPNYMLEIPEVKQEDKVLRYILTQEGYLLRLE